MEERPVGKVAALVIRNGIAGAELLVFDHPLAEGGINVQLPAGAIDPHEEPEAAVVREFVGGSRCPRSHHWTGGCYRRRMAGRKAAPLGLPSKCV